MPPVLYLIALGNLVVGTGAFVVGGLLEPLAASLGVSVVKAGQLMTVYAVASAVAGPLLVAASGRVSRRVVLLTAAAALAVAGAWSASARDFASLAAARVLMAAAGGVFTPAAAAVAVASVPAALRGRALSIAFSGMSLSYVVGVPLGTWAAYRWSWPVAFWAIAAVTAALVLALARLLPATIDAAPAGLGAFGRVLRSGRLMAAMGATVVYFAGIFSLFNYVGPWLRTVAQVTPEALSGLLVAFGVSAFVGTLASGRLVDALGAQRSVLLTCGAMCAVFVALLLLADHPLAIAAVFVAWGAVGFSFMAAQQARLIGMAPAEATALLALNSSMVYVGTAVGAVIGGAVVAVVGWTWLPGASLVLMMAVMGLVRVVDRKAAVAPAAA